jgi:chemotaxis protein methyltransferase CheR
MPMPQSSSKLEITATEYQAISDFLAATSGIVLGGNKQYLVQSRLGGLLKRFDLSSFAELIEALHALKPTSQQIRTAVIDAMTTNETFWFRDKAQFTALQEQVLPELFEHKQGPVRIWSAACSSGQEPYSISICVHKALQTLGKSRNVQIIGTDISEQVLSEARQAVYSELAVSRGLEPNDKAEFFSQVADGYQLNSNITRQVRFQTFNLLKPFSVLGKFDIVFCRNVLIYFSEQIKLDILQRLSEVIEPGGYIFLSSTESMPLKLIQFEPVRHSGTRCYRKK